MRWTVRLAVIGAAVAALGPHRASVRAQDAASETPPPEQPTAPAFEVLARAQEPMNRAFRRLALRDWQGCIEPFDEAAQILDENPLLGGLRDQCVYNVACALSRTGRHDEALASFGDSVANGLRPVIQPISLTQVVTSPGLTLAHVLVDSDLDALRELPAFQAVLRPLLRAGRPRLTLPAEESVTSVLLVLLEGGDTHEAARAVWGTGGHALVTVVPPVRPRKGARWWLLEDGDDRFAIDKVGEALESVRGEPTLAAAPVYVVGTGPMSSEAAWGAALAHRVRVAGLAVRAGRFHAAWHADAIAALSPGFRAVLAGTRPRAAELLRSAGAAVHEVADDEGFEAAALSVLLADD